MARIHAKPSSLKKTTAKGASRHLGTPPRLKVHGIKNVKGTRPATEEDLGLIENDAWRDAVDSDALRVHEGNLSIDGHYAGDGGRLLVQGDLRATGTVSLNETGTLIVTGQLHCKNLHCEGDLEVQGDVVVEETIFGFYEAGITYFHGAVKAKLFLEGNHAFEYARKKVQVDAHLKFDNYDSMKKSSRVQALQVLSDEAIKALGSLIGLGEEDDEADEDDVWTPRLLRSRGFLR
jgi:hypothetical protein